MFMLKVTEAYELGWLPEHGDECCLMTGLDIVVALQSGCGCSSCHSPSSLSGLDTCHSMDRLELLTGAALILHQEHLYSMVIELWSSCL
jgi:hypothetical protein